jgi:hypothetical protein
LSETDSEIVENEFKVSVHKAMHILIGREWLCLNIHANCVS